jgi:hypothetical protein
MNRSPDYPTPPAVRDHYALASTFERAGFSARASRVLANSQAVASLEDLRSQAWHDDGEDRPGLARRLLRTPNCGQAVLREVERYRETGSPKGEPGQVSVNVSAVLQPAEAKALDEWRAAQADQPTRAVAVRRLLTLALGV